jgi:hypothetical protein
MEQESSIGIVTSGSESLRLTRSGARRRGDEYQDVQALTFLVDWLKSNDRYQWLKLEADQSGFLDDILALRTDDVLEIWQVKFSTAAHKPEDVWTWEVLLEQAEGARGAKQSLLQKWFKTWQEYVRRRANVAPGLLSNRRAAPDLTLDGRHNGKVRWSELPEEIKQKILAQLGDEADAQAFFEAFNFRLDEPSLDELEEGSRLVFEKLGGTQDGWHALEKEVRRWVNFKNYPAPEGQIYLDEVRRIAKLKAHPVRLQTFLPPAQFFERYMQPNRLFHHRLPQVGRRAQLQDLLAFVESGTQIDILPGRGGSGKSKLLHTLCRRLARFRPELSVRLVAENVRIVEKALEELPDDKCLIIVDDAHRAEGLEVILAAARQNPALKVLLVTRPHGTDYLNAQARYAGFDRNDIVINELLPELDYAREHRRLARLVLGRDWAHYADKLASITRDSPLLTVLGGELLRTAQVAPSFLSRHDTFRQEVLSRFRDIQLGQIISHLDSRFTPQLCANVLPIVAAVAPFDLENSALLHATARLLEADDVTLKQLLGALIRGGALVRGGRLVRIVPDVLSDFILHEACFTPDGVPTGWATRIYQEVAEFRLDIVLRNLAELDWRVRTAHLASDRSSDATSFCETGLLDAAWSDIEKNFRSSTLAERKAWLTRLERVASVQPHRLWPLVEISLNEASAAEKEDSQENKPWHRPTTQDDVLEGLVPILRGIAHDERFTARCADLLWEMGRDRESKPSRSSSAMETLRQLASYESGKSLTFNYIILDRCRNWMQDPDIHDYRRSVLEVLSPLLSREVKSTEPDGRWLSSRSFKVSGDVLQDLRCGTLNLVERCAQSNDPKVVLKALHALRTPLKEEGLWQQRNENPQEWQYWEWEVLAALEIVARIAECNNNPFVRLKIWEDLHLQAERGPRPAAQSRARQILESIPHSFESRLILLLTNKHGLEQYRRTWVNPEESRANWLKADEPTRRAIDQKHYQRNEEFAGQVVTEWIDKYPDARAGFDALDEWMKSIETSGWWENPWTRDNRFILQLVAQHPTYAREWCEIALQKPEARVTAMCDDLLCELRRRDQRDALELAQQFLANGHPNLQLRVAESYSWRGWPENPLHEEWQIVRDLLASTHPQVRRSAAQIVSNIASIDISYAVELVLNCEIGDDSNFADGLFEVFGEHRGFDFDDITPEDLTRLLGKLEYVGSVRSFNIGQFLLNAALHDPKSVAQLLISRVLQKSKLDKERWESVALDERSLAKQLVDNFGGLPESGFHEEKFQEVVNNADYADALRLIRDAALNGDSRSSLLYEDTLSELFRDFSLNYSSSSLDVLNEWINSEDCQKVRTAIHLLDDLLRFLRQQFIFRFELPAACSRMRRCYV